MSGGPTLGLLPDGRRLHLQHGPIDLIVEAWGAAHEVGAAYAQAGRAFDGLLQGLVDELDALRTPLGAPCPCPVGPVARRMMAAVRPHAHVFVTPMAAVAGAVADHVLGALVAGRDLRRAYVNNGGDIALHLAPGEAFTAGLVFDAHAPVLDGTATIPRSAGVGGIATSGWRGRSLSLGIADCVTVLASTAAAADAAATLIANAVDVDDAAVRRAPASQVRDDTDLGHRCVTVGVGRLGPGAVDAALERGRRAAQEMRARRLIVAAALALQGRTRACGPDAVLPSLAA